MIFIHGDEVDYSFNILIMAVREPRGFSSLVHLNVTFICMSEPLGHVNHDIFGLVSNVNVIFIAISHFFLLSRNNSWTV